MVELSGKDSDSKVTKAAKALYEKLVKSGVEVLYDDRDASTGEKLNDADLIGIPNRIVISEKTLAAKKIELKIRGSKKTDLISETELIKSLL